MSNWNWPDDFPAGCPPLNSVAANGTFYRIVKSDPPTREDFVSTYVGNQTRAERLIAQGKNNHCELLGLSVYGEMGDAIQGAIRYPEVGNFIAAIDASPESGKSMPTPRGVNSHHTWWVTRDFDPTTISQVVHELESLE